MITTELVIDVMNFFEEKNHPEIPEEAIPLQPSEDKPPVTTEVSHPAEESRQEVPHQL